MMYAPMSRASAGTSAVLTGDSADPGWWAARQGRQSPSGRASGRPGVPQSVHSIRTRRTGAPGEACSAGSRGGILSARRRRTKPRGLSTLAGSPAVRAAVR